MFGAEMFDRAGEEEELRHRGQRGRGQSRRGGRNGGPVAGFDLALDCLKDFIRVDGERGQGAIARGMVAGDFDFEEGHAASDLVTWRASVSVRSGSTKKDSPWVTCKPHLGRVSAMMSSSRWAMMAS